MTLVHAHERSAFRSLGRLLAATALLAFGQITLGVLVRVTGAGLACPDWPLCYSQAVPIFNAPIFTQWAYRVASLVLGLVLAATLVRLTTVAALRRVFALPGLLALGLLLAELALAGMAVQRDLPPALVGAHFVGSLLLFSLLVAMAMHARRLATQTPPRPGTSAPVPPVPRTLRTWLAATTGLVMLQAVAGNMAANQARGSIICRGTSACRTVWGAPAWLEISHRSLGLLTVLAVVGLTVAAARTRLPPLVRLTLRVLPSLVALEAVLGIVNVYYNLPIWADAGHAWIAALTYSLLLVTTLDLQLSTTGGMTPPGLTVTRSLSATGA